MSESQTGDNIWVFECPAKVVRCLVRRLSGYSIGVSKTLSPCLTRSHMGNFNILTSAEVNENKAIGDGRHLVCEHAR